MLNATAWENQTSGCVEYRCDPIKGNVSWNMCNSTNETSLACINDTCVETETLSDDGWIVEIGMKDTDVNEVKASEVLEIIGNMTHVDPDTMRLGIEADESGQVLRIFVIAKDERTASVIASVLDECKDDS